MAGYSGTPLAQKLGIKQGHVVGLINEPDEFRGQLEPLPAEVSLVRGVRSRRDVVVIFARRRREIESKLAAMVDAIFPDGGIWVAWPKKAAVQRLNIYTDLDENVIREIAFSIDLVDVKVCAIDDVWSGLRLVVRKENRR